MAAVKSSVAEQIRQLNDARKLVLGDVTYYPTIVQGILPIIGPSSFPELRRWGADFLAEAFATPALPSRDKEILSLLVLENLKAMVENAQEDVQVLRSAIQTAASIYPLVMRWIINNSYDTPTWERMTAIKSRILSIWEGAVSAVKICCIKFAQRVVLAQTVATVAELKRDGLDISLSLVPPNHPILDPRILEAEATGLLDRMLGILQEHSSDALTVDATLNTLPVLVRTRPSTSNRILNAVLNFNPLKLASSPMTAKTRVLIKSMEKTTRMLLIHLSKRDPANPMAPRIQQYVERLLRQRADIFDETGRKRALLDASYGEAKRIKLGTEVPTAQLPIAPLAPGQTSLAAIFTLSNNPEPASFDVHQLPLDLVVRICVSSLARADSQLFDRAVNGIRDRLASLEAAQPQLNPDTVPLGVDDDEDDDYEPDYFAAEDTEQIMNKLDSSPPEKEAAKLQTASLALGAFKLPPPPLVSPHLALKVGEATIGRLFGMMQTLDEPAVTKAKAGLNGVMSGSYNRDFWTNLIIRIATRSTFTREETSPKSESETAAAVAATAKTQAPLSNMIRETLLKHVLEDFRKRIDVAVLWLCEEWYNDKMERRSEDDVPLHYEKWTMRLLDGFLPYLHPQDKVLTRFLGELPELNAAMMTRVKNLCKDPSMVPLALTSLLYLVVMRPPAKDLALDTVQDIWTEFEDGRPTATKYLVRWRPGFIESQRAKESGQDKETAMAERAAVAT